MRHTILALDLATTTGWALHEQGLGRPYFGAFRLPGGPMDVGKPAEALRAFLADQHKLFGITDIVFEAQHIGANINVDTVYRLMALGGIVEWFAFRIGARCYKVHISEWRKHFIGRGSGFKRGPRGYLPGEDPKDKAIAKCAEFGWHTDIADAAEACGILDFYMNLLVKASPGYTVPWRDRGLFGGRGR